jgi:1,4-dihydroxy-2-naphthoate octaprenyltransferase
MTEAATLTRSGGDAPGRLKLWIRAIRAPSLSAAAIPVMLGGAIAWRDGFFSGARFILALLGALAIQAGTNLINDYYDYLKGADSLDSLGPSLVIQQGLLSADQVRKGGIIAFAIGSALGLVLVYLCGWPILLIGVFSVAAGYFYTAAPVALAYVALGEITVFIFMGPVIVIGAYYVMALRFAAAAVWASIPLGFLVAGILHANNIRDIESDRAHGKRTLATLLGRRGANYELVVLDVAAYASAVVGAAAGILPWTVLIVLVTIPRARHELQIVFRETESRRLNVALFRAVQLHMEFGLLMIVAFALARAIGR